MKMTGVDIYNDIMTFVNKTTGINLSRYYIGITNDIDRRLFNEHRVAYNNPYVSYEALDAESARQVEKRLLGQGMKGGDGGGSDESVYVYCYLITPFTVE